MSGLSEQGLPLDTWAMETPLSLLTLGVYTKIGGSRDPSGPQGDPCSEQRGLLVLSSVPPGQLRRGDPPIFI